MIDKISSMQLKEYCACIEENGTRIFIDQQQSAWIKYEGFAIQRFPTFTTTPPSKHDLYKICIKTSAAIASYIVEPDAKRPPNSYLYVVEKGNYSIELLPYATRKNVKRANQSFTFKEIDWLTLNNLGLQAFVDTRSRANLSDNTINEFEKKINSVKNIHTHHIIGCFYGEQLAAYLGFVVINDFAEITFWYSTNEHLQYRSNDGLFYNVFYLLINKLGLTLVSDGLSSLQLGEGSGLHHFKVRLGLIAKPVHRTFYINPLIRPFINRLTLKLTEFLLKRNKKNRRLRKINGVLHIILNAS